MAAIAELRSGLGRVGGALRGLRHASRGTFVSILLATAILTAVFVIAVSTILHLQAERILLTRIQSETKATLLQATYSAELLAETVRRTASRLHFDLALDRMIALPAPDEQTVSATLTKLERGRLAAPGIHSLYVYSAPTDTFYICAPIRACTAARGSAFYAQEMRFISEQASEAGGGRPVPRILHDPDVYDNDLRNPAVYSFLYNYSLSEREADASFIIVNIAASWMDLAASTADAFGGSLLVVDRSGRTVGSGGGGASFEDLSTTPVIRRILDSSSAEGFFMEGSGKGRSLVVYLSQASTGWVFVRVLPFSVISGDLGLLRMTSLLVVFVAVSSAILLAVFLSLRISRPIDAIKARLEQLEGERTESLAVPRQAALRRLVGEARALDPEHVRQLLEEFHVNWEAEGRFTMFLLVIDGFAEFCRAYAPAERERVRRAAMAVAASATSSHRREVVGMAESHVVIVLYCRRGEELPVGAGAAPEARELQRRLKEDIALSLTVVASREAERVTELPALYAECMRAATGRYFLGRGALIGFESSREAFPRVPPEPYAYPIDREKHFVEALLVGNIAEMTGLFDSVMKEARRHSYENVRSAEGYLAYAANRGIRTLADSIPLGFPYDFDDFLSRLRESETVEETRGLFLDLFGKVSDTVRKRRGRRSAEVVEEVRSIIAERYASPTLYVGSIAEEVGMSAAYLGRMFKGITGRSIPDYLTDVRMNKARGLLSGTERPVSEVATATGFMNVPYFYRIFKKYHGVTPADFRRHPHAYAAGSR